METLLKTNNTKKFNPQNTPLLFAETTYYLHGKGSKYKDYSSNIEIKNESGGSFRLYHIYRYRNLWGLTRNQNAKNPWKGPKWCLSLQDAINKANELYMEEDFMEEEVVVAEKQYILYCKYIDPPTKKHRREEIIREDTYFTLKPEEVTKK